MKPQHSIYIILAIAFLTSFVSAEKFPFADGTFDENNKLEQWSLERVRKYRDDTIGQLTNDDGTSKGGPEKDAAADPLKLNGYPSPEVESKIFTTLLDLTDVTGLVYVAIHVDDIANLTATEIDDAGEPIGTPIPYDLKGSALWKAEKSYKEFPNPIPGGKKYSLNLNYTNTVNLTDKYDGLIDYDGVNVFLMHHPAVDLDVDSNNNEGFEFTWGHPNEDKIEASADLSEPGKIIAVPLDPDADKDGVPDALDGFDGRGITLGDTQFVQMVVSIPSSYDPETATLGFNYKMSDPRGLSAGATHTTSGFRLWTSDAAKARLTADIPDAVNSSAGYFIPAGQEIPWKNLAAQCAPAKSGVYDGPAIILYIETVLTSGSGSSITVLPFAEKEPITVTAKPEYQSSEFNTSDTANIAVRCTGGVKITGPKAIVVNDNHHNRDTSGNQMDQWDYTNDRTGTLDPDVLPIAIEVIALDQDVWVTLSSEAMKGLGEPGTPTTGGLIDGVFPGDSEPAGTATDPDGQSKKGWKEAPYTFKVDKNTTFKQNLYIEGQRHSATLDDVVIKVETTEKGIITGDPKPCIATTESEHKMTVYQVDLDVDSDNDNILALTDAEDQIETSANLSGKVIFTTLSSDTNRDGIPDFQNGVNGKPVDKSANFTPIKLRLLPEPFDPLSTEITLSYEEAQVGKASPTCGLRIWTANATSHRSVEKSLINKDAPISWDVLLGKTKMRGRDVTLYIETINSLGNPIAGDYEITVTARQQGAIDAVDKVKILLLYGEIEKVISDQIAGNECNSLPSKAYGLQPNNPMLMATRSGKDARLQIIADVPASHAAEIRVGIRVVNNSNVILGSAAALPGGAKTPLAFTAVDDKKLYEVVIGYDKNHDAKLTNDEVINTFERTPRTDPGGKAYTGGDTNFTYIDKILIVTRNDYIAARKETEAYATGWLDSRTFPLGNELLRAFSTGGTVLKGANPPVGGFIVDASVIPSTQGLSHPLGRTWNTLNQATTHKIVYPNKSKMSKKVLGSPVFTSLVGRIISANKSSLLATATTTWKTSPPIAFVDKNVAFRSGVLPSDLHLALGKCNAIGEVRIKYRSAPGGNIEVNAVQCYGSIEDLYDWAFGIKFVYGGKQLDLPKVAARTQAGHATLASAPLPNAGRIFFTEVQFNSGWKNWGNTIY